MGGGLMQLVAYGAQDIYLTGNPQITFFKDVYRRHTNFAMEYIQQTINGTVTSGSRVTATLARSGDLVYDCYLEVQDSISSASNHIFQEVGSRVPTSTTTNTPIVASNIKVAKGYLSNLGVHNVGPMNVGTSFIDEVSVEIGGQQIDKQYGHSMEVWNQLTMKNTSEFIEPYYITDFHPHSSDINNKQKMMQSGGVYIGTTGKDLFQPPNDTRIESTNIRVPLNFWFNKHPGLALPLIALQYHEVEIVLKIHDFSDTLTHATNDDKRGGWNSQYYFFKDSNTKLKLWCNYIFLDTDERRMFAQTSHEYLIEQWQYQQNKAGSRFKLNFNHPVKELIWCGAPDSMNPSTPTGLLDISQTGEELYGLKLNGVDRFVPKSLDFFTTYMIEQYHGGQGGKIGLKGELYMEYLDEHCFTVIESNGKSTTYTDIQKNGNSGRRYIKDSDQVHVGGLISNNAPSIAVFSFALKPEEHQPSGTCNFSRIDNAEIYVSDGNMGRTAIASTASPYAYGQYGTNDCNWVVNGDNINIYAINYNVLRIMSGMGGLAYSN